MTVRLAHLVTHPIQYFAPLYRELAKKSEVDFTVLFGSDYGTRSSYDVGFARELQFDTPLLDGYQYRLLTNCGSGSPNGQYRSFDCPELYQILKAGTFDALWVHGWGYRAQWQAIRAARKVRIPLLVRAETSAMTTSSTPVRACIRRLFVASMLKKAAGCLYVGQSNRQFLKSMGVSDARLFPAHYSIDTEFFRSRAVNGIERANIRSQYGADESSFVLVIAAKAIPLKRIDDAIAAVGQSDENTRLWVVGDGLERPRLEQMAETVAPGRVRWLGFVNQSEMPRILSSADASVLCSTSETWGLAIHEGLACGIPALATDRVGSALDLVINNVTGYTYPVRDVAALRQCILTLQRDRVLCRRMGVTGQQRVQADYDVKKTATQIVEAVQIVTRRDN